MLHKEKNSAPRVLDRWYDQSAIKEIVVLFAGSLGDEQAAMTGGAMQIPAFVNVGRFVLSANRIIRAESG